MSGFELVLCLRKLGLSLPRKEDRDELDRIADRFHALLVRAEGIEKILQAATNDGETVPKVGE